MKILVDANVWLDVALARPGLHDASGRALAHCGQGDNAAFVAWHTLSNVYYILQNQADRDQAIAFLSDLLAWVEVVNVGHTDALRAMGYGMRDFEDALQLSAAEACAADVILTRNVSDFRGSPIPARTPEELIGA